MTEKNPLDDVRAMHKEIQTIVAAPRVAPEGADTSKANPANLVEMSKQMDEHVDEAEFLDALAKFLSKYELDYLPAVRLPNGDLLIRQTEGMVAINKRRARGKNLAAAMRTLMADETGPDMGSGWVS